MPRLRHGIDHELEDLATQMIAESYADETNPRRRGDILTPGMYEARLRREVFTADGAPDGAVRQGLFHRVYNPAHPHLNSRDGARVPPPSRSRIYGARDAEANA